MSSASPYTSVYVRLCLCASKYLQIVFQKPLIFFKNRLFCVILCGEELRWRHLTKDELRPLAATFVLNESLKELHKSINGTNMGGGGGGMYIHTYIHSISPVQ